MRFEVVISSQHRKRETRLTTTRSPVGGRQKEKERKGVNYLRVHGFVLLQAHCVAEGFAAQFARERPGAAVRPADVHLQTVRSGEHLRAHFMGEVTGSCDSLQGLLAAPRSPSVLTLAHLTHL